MKKIGLYIINGWKNFFKYVLLKFFNNKVMIQVRLGRKFLGILVLL